jgi:hypothetical protein
VTEFRPEKTWEQRRGYRLFCPWCGWMSNSSLRDGLQHHFSMRKVDWNDLKVHRRAILELYPAFGGAPCWYPVWDELAHPLHTSVENPANGSSARQSSINLGTLDGNSLIRTI